VDEIRCPAPENIAKQRLHASLAINADLSFDPDWPDANTLGD
jgi:hypothetical protein